MPQSVPYTDAGLAKRLAEAADSFRDGLYHYFVCNIAFPYDLHYTGGWECDEDASSEAQTLKQGLSGDYFIFGPYKTGSSEEPAIEYDAIHIRFMQNENELYCESLSNNTDAIVLSLSAYDKFIQPYYVRLYGIDVAEEFRANAVTALTSTPRQSVIHKGGKLGSGTGGTRFKAGDYER